MKVHLQRVTRIFHGYEDVAMAVWKREGLIPGLVRDCDGKMAMIKNSMSLTSNTKEVTCKRCMRLNK